MDEDDHVERGARLEEREQRGVVEVPVGGKRADLDRAESQAFTHPAQFLDGE